MLDSDELPVVRRERACRLWRLCSGPVLMIYSREGGGSHGHYWEVIELARPFEGSPEEREANTATHHWATELLTTTCRVCGLKDYESESTYPCGTTDFPRRFIMTEYYGNDEPISYEWTPRVRSSNRNK